MRERIQSIILDRLREHMAAQGAEPSVALGPDTALLGQRGVVDSLGLVTVVVSVEQSIEDELGAAVTLADERAFSQRTSPFRTVGSLAAYAEELLAGVR